MISNFQYFNSNKLLCASIFMAYALSVVGADNLSCYQCTKNKNEECGPETLLPCPPISDRCVTHLKKDAETGFMIKRECGLGPCGFNDDMVNKGLGLGGCDRSKDDYFCVFCCKESGCNKSGSTSTHTVSTALRLAFVIIFISTFVKYC